VALFRAMRLLGLGLLVAGVALAVSAFLIVANAPSVTSWAIVAGFGLMSIGIVVH